MIDKIAIPGETFIWVDVVDPSKEELEVLALEYSLPPGSVSACLDPEHLPKYEETPPVHFMIVRAFDETCSPEADSVQELTRKVAIFFSENFLMTVHRRDLPFMVKLRAKWRQRPKSKANSLHALMADISREVFHSYRPPIEEAMNKLEILEMSVFGAHGALPFQIEEAYYLKRKAATFKRLLRLTLDLFGKSSQWPKGNAAQMGRIRDEAEKAYYYAVELLENTNTLLNLHLSLASQRTNEVMRVLTILSVFILPLNVVTGIYGMNFQHMPELASKVGYPLVLVSMAAIVIGIYIWFKRRGWLKSLTRLE